MVQPRMKFANSALLKKGYAGDGETRYVLKITITRRVIALLRSVVRMGKGGRASGLIESAIELMLALLSVDITKDRKMLARLVGRFFEAFDLDMLPMRAIADNLEYVAAMFRRAHKTWEEETGEKYSLWMRNQKRQNMAILDVKDLLLPYDERNVR